MKVSERIGAALAVINSCAMVQVEPRTYCALVSAIGELKAAEQDARAMESLDVRAARFVADTPASDFHEELHKLFAGTATASVVEELAS